MKLLSAKAHRWGAGKVHIVSGEKTLCGRQIGDCPGDVVEGGHGDVTCKACLSSQQAEVRREEWRQEWRQREAERAEENRRWWEWYDAYLRSPGWMQRRSDALRRDGGICRGCLSEPATQVHHLTYERVGAEMLFDLVSVCDACHRRIHESSRASHRAHNGKPTEA